MDVNLLIADADAPCRQALARFFRHCGFSVATAATDLECLAALRECEPDILIVDCEIFWGGGNRIVTRINEGSDLSKLPAVLVLGGAPADVLARRAGVPRSCCLPKPVQILRLVDAVCPLVAAIESRTAADPVRDIDNDETPSLRPNEVVTSC